jgi:hypothetical protein
VPSRRFRLSPFIALLAAGAVTAALVPPVAAATPAEYSRAVTQICAHARLFEEPHSIGTRAGALELADDIRASAARRLARVTALASPRGRQRSVNHWLALERRLAEAYAVTYVRVYDLIAEPRTPEQRPRTALRLAKLMSAPDSLRRAAARYERQLRVPDCTGG